MPSVGTIFIKLKPIDMTTFFRKSIKILPGVRVNFGKKSTSVSIGPRGAKITTGTKGTHVSVGLPGTGMYCLCGKRMSFEKLYAAKRQ